MKIRKALLLVLLLPLVGCSSNPDEGSSSSSSSTSGSTLPDGEIIDPDKIDGLASVDSIQDVPILHAWNWKINDVKTRLEKIKNAGYGAIQLSPLQPKVDKTNYPTQSTSSQWWKLYQPLAFKVATADENFLGTKADLTALCAAAKEYDIKIVMDIVCNHLAGNASGYNSQVSEYTQYPLHNYGMHSDDNNGESVVKGHINLPDLDTSNTQVQQDALAMLKEYIDCGVSGFRFDAAKHIETPDDGSYASNFWTVVLGGTTSYATSKGLDEPYYYGEVLNTPGAGRSFGSYTKMMSICDNKQGTSIVSAVKDNNLGSIKSTFDTNESPEHLVLWAESHDTYANTSGYDLTTSYPIEVINKAYVIQTSRKDANSLYFSRPTNMGVTITSINDNGGYKFKDIRAINVFHRLFVDKSESINNNNGCFVNVRGSGDYVGAAIVNISGSSTQNVSVPGLKDGTYFDLVSQNDFVVSGGTVNATFTNGACILIPKAMSEGIHLDDDTGYDSNIVIKGADSTKSYLAWNWTNEHDGRWLAFDTDKDAIGVNLTANSNYIIVEFPSGTTASSANWGSKIRQTYDLQFSGTQIIHEFNSISWK